MCGVALVPRGRFGPSRKRWQNTNLQVQARAALGASRGRRAVAISAPSMSMAAAISGDDAKVFHWSEDPRAITCITLDGVASDERRRAYLRRRASVPWRGTSMDGVPSAPRAQCSNR